MRWKASCARLEARARTAENMIEAAAVLSEAGVGPDSPQAPRLFRELVALPDGRAMRAHLREAGVDERALKLRDSTHAPSTYTPAVRKLLAKEGKARPDGSYPIRTAKDVEDAVEDFHSQVDGTPEDKAHIIACALAVPGGWDKLPEDWRPKRVQQESERLHQLGIPTLDGLGPVRLREATAADLDSLAQRGIPVLDDSPLGRGSTAPALDGIPLLAEAPPLSRVPLRESEAPGTLRHMRLTESDCGTVIGRVA